MMWNKYDNIYSLNKIRKIKDDAIQNQDFVIATEARDRERTILKIKEEEKIKQELRIKKLKRLIDE